MEWSGVRRGALGQRLFGGRGGVDGRIDGGSLF